jgi:hypothetical protein
VKVAIKIFAPEDEDLENIREALLLDVAQRFLRGVELHRELLFFRQNMRLTEDFHLRLISIFNQYKLDYLVVGGHAVNIHGYLRASDDFDIWLHNTTANLARFRLVLKQIGLDKERIYELVHTLARPNDRSVYRFNIEGYNIDFMLALAGIDDFEITLKNAVIVTLAEQQIPFISLEDLIRAKKASNRLKDQLDVEMLLKIQELKENKSF